MLFLELVFYEICTMQKTTSLFHEPSGSDVFQEYAESYTKMIILRSMNPLKCRF